MPQSFRHPEIIEIARTEGKVTVDDLSARFGVSVQTIRRDLTDLANAGQLARVHGGAILPSGIRNIVYEERRLLNSAAKERMARHCAALVPNDACIFLNIGTSTEALARELAGHRNMMVVTNNMNVAQILGINPDCEIILTGGAFRPADGGLTGTLAADALETFKFDLAVIGCSGVDADGDILDFDQQEVIVSQRALSRARSTILLADHSKFSRPAPLRIASIARIDRVITDADLPGPVARVCNDAGTKVDIARP